MRDAKEERRYGFLTRQLLERLPYARKIGLSRAARSHPPPFTLPVLPAFFVFARMVPAPGFLQLVGAALFIFSPALVLVPGNSVTFFVPAAPVRHAALPGRRRLILCCFPMLENSEPSAGGHTPPQHSTRKSTISSRRALMLAGSGPASGCGPRILSSPSSTAAVHLPSVRHRRICTVACGLKMCLPIPAAPGALRPWPTLRAPDPTTLACPY